MSELDIDLADRTPDPRARRTGRHVITMGCGDQCPYIPGKRYIDWNLADPAGQPIEQVRAIRDDIAHRVANLVTDIEG